MSPAVRDTLLAMLLAAFAAVPRLVFLDADPPPSAQFHFFSDEGQYAHNARNHALSGRWVTDDLNGPLVTAPLHTLLVRASYAVFGTGLAETRLPGAVAGVLTCLLPWWLLRARAGRRAAFTAALLLAASPFVVAQHRIGWTEPVQALAVSLAVLALDRAGRRPAWAVLAGGAAVAALAAKVASLPLLAVLAAQLAWMGRAPGPARAAAVRAALLCAATGAVLGGGLFAAFALPHLPLVRAEFEAAARIATSATPPVSLLDRALWFGFREDPERVRVLGGLFAAEPVLVALALWVLIARLLHPVRGGAGGPFAACVLWALVMLAGIATHPSFAPDRRYLLLVPPLALLVAFAAFPADPGEGAPGARRASAARIACAWLLAGFGLALLLRAPALDIFAAPDPAFALASGGASRRTALAAAWLAAFMAAAVVWIPAVRARLRPPPPRIALAACALVVLGGAWQAGQAARNARWTIRDAARAIAAATEGPAGVVAGTTAETFALESRHLALVVRDWPHAAVFTNLERFARRPPAWAVVTWTRSGRPLAGSESFPLTDYAEAAEWRVWEDARGAPRLRTVLYARAAAAGGTDGTPAP